MNCWEFDTLRGFLFFFYYFMILSKNSSFMNGVEIFTKQSKDSTVIAECLILAFSSFTRSVFFFLLFLFFFEKPVQYCVTGSVPIASSEFALQRSSLQNNQFQNSICFFKALLIIKLLFCIPLNSKELLQVLCIIITYPHNAISKLMNTVARK